MSQEDTRAIHFPYMGTGYCSSQSFLKESGERKVMVARHEQELNTGFNHSFERSVHLAILRLFAMTEFPASVKNITQQPERISLEISQPRNEFPLSRARLSPAMNI